MRWRLGVWHHYCVKTPIKHQRSPCLNVQIFPASKHFSDMLALTTKGTSITLNLANKYGVYPFKLFQDTAAERSGGHLGSVPLVGQEAFAGQGRRYSGWCTIRIPIPKSIRYPTITTPPTTMAIHSHDVPGMRFPLSLEYSPCLISRGIFPRMSIEIYKTESTERKSKWLTIRLDESCRESALPHVESVS